MGRGQIHVPTRRDSRSHEEATLVGLILFSSPLPPPPPFGSRVFTVQRKLLLFTRLCLRWSWSAFARRRQCTMYSGWPRFPIFLCLAIRSRTIQRCVLTAVSKHTVGRRTLQRRRWTIPALPYGSFYFFPDLYSRQSAFFNQLFHFFFRAPIVSSGAFVSKSFHLVRCDTRYCGTHKFLTTGHFFSIGESPTTFAL